MNPISPIIIRRGNFTLSSGQKSKVFFDVKSTLILGQNSFRIVEDLCKLIGSSEEHYLVGAGTGGAMLCALLHYRGYYRCFYVDKQERFFGEGAYDKQKTLVVVDDVITTGASIDRTLKISRGVLGLSEDIRIVCVVDRCENNPAFESLYKGSDLTDE